MELHSVSYSRICFFFFSVEAEGILLTRGRNKERQAAAVSPRHIEESAAARSHNHGFGALNLMEQEWK